MKIKYRANNNLEFEIDGDGQKEIFKDLASLQEVFGEENCGCCKKSNFRFVVRNVEDNDYYEIRCNECGAVLPFGQHKKGNTLFPKRKDDQGNWMKDRGWYKWQEKDTVKKSK